MRAPCRHRGAASGWPCAKLKSQRFWLSRLRFQICQHGAIPAQSQPVPQSVRPKLDVELVVKLSDRIAVGHEREQVPFADFQLPEMPARYRPLNSPSEGHRIRGGVP